MSNKKNYEIFEEALSNASCDIKLLLNLLLSKIQPKELLTV